jgi:hypothetical protein
MHILKHLSDWKWAILHRFHPNHRYHVVPTGLNPGWHEIDERILHGCMSLLCSYVEKQQDGEESLQKHIGELWNMETEGTQNQALNEEEALKIYKWWKYEREKDWEHYNKWMSTLYSKIDLTFDDIGDGLVDVRSSGNPDISMGTSTELCEYENTLNAKDDEMLNRLINIRRSLWT